MSINSPSRILPVNQLAGFGAPQVLADYGIKTAGYLELLQMQSDSPVAYSVPPAWAIPRRAVGTFGTHAIANVFHELTESLPDEAVLMARSSAVDESPGENPTLFAVFNRADIAESRKRFLDAVDAVTQTSETMAALATVAVGSMIEHGGEKVFGLSNVSFIADSHSPLKPSEMHFALVHGLGTHVVDGSYDCIIMTAMRNSGLITFFGNQKLAASQIHTGSTNPVTSALEYRQELVEYVSMEDGRIYKTDMSTDLLKGCMNVFWVKDGRLVTLEELPLKFRWRLLGYTPFGSIAMPSALITILQYISACGAVQIEGAFASTTQEVPYLYQLIHTPELEIDPTPLSIKNPSLTSTSVIGRASCTVPLVWIKHEIRDSGNWLEYLHRLDTAYGPNGYALLADRHYNELMRATPNCRIRFSRDPENPSSHVVTNIRFRIGKDPDAGYLLAMNVKIDSERMSKSSKDKEKVVVFDKAHIESNGEELAVSIAKTPPAPSIV